MRKVLDEGGIRDPPAARCQQVPSTSPASENVASLGGVVDTRPYRKEVDLATHNSKPE